MNIAFILGSFPNLSETFILNQVTGLMDLGNTVLIFPKVEEKGLCHPDFDTYELRRFIFCPLKYPKSLIKKYLKAFPFIIKYLFTDFKRTAKCFNPARFGKQALNLSVFYQLLPFLGKKIDIIQVHYADYLDRAALLKQIGNKAPIILMLHGSDLRNLIESKGSLYRDNFRYVDKFLAISKYSFNTLLDYKLPAEKIMLHPVGISAHKFFSATEKVKSKNDIVILSVGRLEVIKGHFFGLEAFALLHHTFPHLSLSYRIIGGGSELEKLRSKAVQLKINEFVTFSGSMIQEEIIDEYKNADIYLHPSLEEITPLAIMEAFAAGLPVIASNVGAVSELVQDGLNGFLTNAKDPAKMAHCVGKLILQPELRIEFGANGRKLISANYDSTILNKRLELLYTKCLTA